MNCCRVTPTQADLLPPSLQYILVRSCGIAYITYISGDTSQRDTLPRLRTLNLSQNYLKALPPCMLPSCLVALSPHSLLLCPLCLPMTWCLLS